MRESEWRIWEVRQIPSFRCRLGEGCVWDARSGRLYFVDIEGCKIHWFRPVDGSAGGIDTDDMAGCLALCRAGEGGIVAAIGHRLVRITEDGVKLEILTELILPDYVRFNDGKCDSQGRLWVGTMAKNQEHPKAKGCGSLICIEDNRVTAEYPGYTIPNGMAWDGERFYHIDTSKGMIEEYRMEDSGRLGGRKTAVSVNPADGSPDGMSIDEEGNLWVAMWGGKKVCCYHPQTGEKLGEIPVPVKNVSCVTFGDEDLKTLYITTAMDGDGLGGQLYAVRLPVAGVLPYEYGGRR